MSKPERAGVQRDLFQRLYEGKLSHTCTNSPWKISLEFLQIMLLCQICLFMSVVVFKIVINFWFALLRSYKIKQQKKKNHLVY